MTKKKALTLLEALLVLGISAFVIIDILRYSQIAQEKAKAHQLVLDVDNIKTFLNTHKPPSATTNQITESGVNTIDPDGNQITVSTTP